MSKMMSKGGGSSCLGPQGTLGGVGVGLAQPRMGSSKVSWGWVHLPVSLW